MAPNKKQVSVKNAYKSHVVKAADKLGAALEEDSKDAEQLTALIESLDIKFKKYETKATQLHDEMDDEQEEAMLKEIDEIDKLEEYITMMKVKAQSSLKKLQTEKPQNDEKKEEPKVDQRKSRMKLPLVELTEFNGEDDQAEFPAFIDMFTALIDTNKDLQDVEKFHYLRKATTKRAGRLMNAYPLSDQNYQIALDKLKEEYGDERRLISKHFNALLDYKTTCHNWKDLQDFHDFVETKLKCLEALNSPVDDKNDMVITLIIRQVPEMIQRKIAKLENDERTIPNAMKIIKKEVKANENRDSMLGKDTSLQDVYEEGNQNIEKYYRYGERRETNSSAAALPVVNNNNRPRQCPFCTKNHSPFTCTEVTDINKRREIVRKSNRCFNCLIPGHPSRECRSKYVCQTCHERHHTSICFRNSSPRTGYNNNSQTSTHLSTSQSHGRDNNNLLHPTQENFFQSQADVNNQNQQSAGRTPHQTGGYHTSTSGWCRRGPVILETAIAEMKTTQGKLRVRLFFDKGSQYSYILKTVADSANLPTVEEEILSVNTFAKKKSEEIASDLKKVDLCKGTFKISMLCNTVETVCVPLQSTSLREKDQYELKNLQMADPESFTAERLQVDILVGNDYYQDFMSGEVHHTSFGPVVIKSYLGWVLSGPVSNAQNRVSNTQSNLCIVNHVTHQHLEDLQLDEYSLTTRKNKMLHEFHSEQNVSISHLQPVNMREITPPIANCTLQRNCQSTHTLLSETFKSCNDIETEKELDWFWEVEHVGILPEELEPTILQEYNQSVQYDQHSKRYTVRWPWKEDIAHKLLDNRRLCEKRLDTLLQRLNLPSNDNLRQKYHEIIHNQLQDGIIEEVTNTEQNSFRKHYSPHHPVIKEDKSTTSVRVVYDGSAKAHQGAVSLNQCMYAGPSLIKDLVSILMKFRMFNIGIVADIRKAFLQMSLAEEDRDVTRFLWREQGKPSNPLKVYRFCRVPFGMTASPFLLQATLIHHISKYKAKYPVTTSKLLESFYVDDLTTGCETTEEAKMFIFEATTILKEAGMTLTKWKSSHKEVQSFIRTSIENPTLLNDDDDNTLKILGILWDLKDDTLSCSANNSLQQIQSIKPTKRNVLKCIAKVFDPMGHIAPYVISAKILMQELSKMKLDWDTMLTGDLLNTWKDWISGLMFINEIKLPRHLFNGLPYSLLKLELVGFSDASTRAYAASVYIKYEFRGKVQVKLLISKSRVAPMRKMTIPRLELLGSVFLARLMATVKNFLPMWKFINVTYYTDSMNVLYWIKGKDKDWSRYLKNRLIEICSLSSPNDWYHCPGEINPADLLTRGISAEQMTRSSVYYNGPHDLKIKNNLQIIEHITPPQECLKELKKDAKVMTTTTTNTFRNVIDIKKYSSYKRLIHITALVIQFINHLRKNQLTLLQCMTIAELLWIKEEQHNHFANEIIFIKNIENKIKTKKNEAGNLVKQWSLFLDKKELLRCRGRFEYAEMSYDAKYPIILPKNSHLTTLIIADRHLSLNHAGTKQTFVQIRSEFWIPSARRLIKDFITKCIPCRRLKAKPYQPPPTGSLPELRLSNLPPFTNTGTDFAGPVFIHYTEISKRETFKSYINIFTCASTRAIHLELVPDLTTNCFIHSLDRFTSRRGIPHVMVSDNAKTFKCAANELNCIITSSSYQASLADQRIRWFFYLEKSPWWGGFIERMVGSVKSLLRRLLYRALLNYEEMTTVLTRIESIINSRPITYTYVDDVVEPLTPSHLLIGKRTTELPPRTTENSTYIQDGRNEYLEKITRQFEIRWKTEYLAEVQDHHITMKKNKNEEIVPRVGDVVILKEDVKPRTQWPLARVTKLFPGRGDKKIRSIEVQKSNGNLIRRPPQLLIPLEFPQ